MRYIVQAILSVSGYFASFFVSPDSINYDFVVMGVSLVLLIVVVIIIMLIPEVYRRWRNRNQESVS